MLWLHVTACTHRLFFSFCTPGALHGDTRVINYCYELYPLSILPSDIQSMYRFTVGRRNVLLKVATYTYDQYLTGVTHILHYFTYYTYQSCVSL